MKIERTVSIALKWHESLCLSRPLAPLCKSMYTSSKKIAKVMKSIYELESISLGISPSVAVSKCYIASIGCKFFDIASHVL